MRGIVENIEFTSGGAGNQFTTISGVKYVTFWDIRSTDWRVGDEVTFDVSTLAVWSGGCGVAHAANIHKAPDTCHSIRNLP